MQGSKRENVIYESEFLTLIAPGPGLTCYTLRSAFAVVAILLEPREVQRLADALHASLWRSGLPR